MVCSRLSGAAMLTVTMVRKADYSGYRLFITPEMEGYPTDENQAAAYMNKIIEKEIMRAPEQYLWIHRRFKTRPVGESSLYIKQTALTLSLLKSAIITSWFLWLFS